MNDTHVPWRSKARTFFTGDPTPMAEHGAVVAIGSDLAASILTTSRIMRSGHRRIWAKTITEAHAEILAQLGVKQIVNPEDDMGRRLAHLIRGHMSAFLRIDSDYAIVRTQPSVRVLGQPLSALGLRGTHGVTVIAVKHPGAGWANTDGGIVLEADDEIIIAGAPDAVERFSALDKHV